MTAPTHRVGSTSASVYYEHSRPKPKAPFGVQTRRDTTDAIQGEPEYVHPDKKPGMEVEHDYKEAKK